jgi:hypothetical protein
MPVECPILFTTTDKSRYVKLSLLEISVKSQCV